MNLQSIKWQLQLWHGLVLVLVLAGFGFTAHRLDRESRFRRIDAELQQRATVVLGALRRGGGPPRDGGAPRGPVLSPRDLALFNGAETEPVATSTCCAVISVVSLAPSTTTPASRRMA